MTNESSQPRLLGFAGERNVPDKAELRRTLRSELGMLREKLGGRVIAFSSAATGTDLVFLRACTDLRIPFIVVLPFPRQGLAEAFENPQDRTMAEHLVSVALAEYVAPGGKAASDVRQIVFRNLLEWADSFLFAWNGDPDGPTGEAVAEASDLGIPCRIVDSVALEARWTFEPDSMRGARHGFATRKELLEFFDARFG